MSRHGRDCTCDKCEDVKDSAFRTQRINYQLRQTDAFVAMHRALLIVQGAREGLEDWTATDETINEALNMADAVMPFAKRQRRLANVKSKA